MTTPKIAGRSPVRKDIIDKVTGRARYVSDLQAPGMCHAVLVRSQVPHGLLRGVDTAQAAGHPGVVSVATAADFTDCDMYYGESVLDQPFLAIDKVRYVGEPVAAVVAETLEAARAAAKLVVAEVEPLPTLNSAEEALVSPTRIHPERPVVTEDLANVCSRSVFEYGDVDGAMASAAYVHDATYRFPAVYHYAMEPFSYLATWDEEGLDMWSSTQQPHKVRADLARIFRLPMSRVRVRIPYVGGGYGSKGQSKYEPVTAGLARLARRPVRLVTSVEEAFHTVTRHEAVVRMRTAVDADGAITARDTTVVYDTGAYADKGPRVARKGAYRASGPYCIPNTRSVGLAVYSNRVPAGAFRGFSTPQVVWAGESAIDEIARHLGQDPLEYRADRLTPRGRPFLGDDAPMDADLAQGLRMAADAIGWGTEPVPGRGRGVASGVKDGGGGAARSEAEVRLQKDGSVEVIAATSELGQGAHTVLAQIAAEMLGVDYEAVRVRFPDTVAERFDPGTNASRSTIAVGNAVQEAAVQVHQELCQAAELVLGSSAGLHIDGGDVVVGTDSISLVDLLSRARGLAPDWLGSLSAVAAYDTSKGDGPLGHTSAFYEVGHAAAEVEVDRDTGQVTITRYASVADVGFAVHPGSCEGQDEGATVMGIGHTLFEELEFDGGELRNATLVEYRVPRAEDVPEELHTILLENRDGPGPFGAKGAGEGGTLAVAPAVANAVEDAVGVRIRDLPLTPERVWRALQAAGRTADEAAD